MKTHPWHWSFNLGFSFQHLHHLDAITASSGWSCCSYQRSPPPKKLLYSKLSQGKHSQGGLKKCFEDSLKVSMKSFGIVPNCLEYLAQDRDKWCEVVKCGAKVYETRRSAATELHWKLRKGTATSATAATIPCSHCLRLFHARIGLISHLHPHRCLPQSKGWSDGPHRIRWTKKNTFVKGMNSLISPAMV